MESSFFSEDFSLSLSKANLNLRSAFGTSHSSTTTRTNAMITIRYKDAFGYGEIGLPPKKKHCYLADYDDIEHFFNQYQSFVKTELQRHSLLEIKSYKTWLKNDNGEEEFYEPFKNLVGFFSSLRVNDPKEEIPFERALPFLLLKVLDRSHFVDRENKLPEFRFAAMCGIEMAIFDLFGTLFHKPLHELIGIEAPLEKYSFYTAALNENILEIVKTAKFGLGFTHHLKIKLDEDLDKAVKILAALLDLNAKEGLHATSWSVDANSAWNPDLTLKFLDTIRTQLPEFLKYLYMVEQPFPVEKNEIQKFSEQWKEVKQQYEKEGIYLFADESISTAEHIPLIQDYVHGVNIKLEKAGGVRGALEAILVAKENNLKIWLGCMVSTRLSCTCSAHLLSLSEIGGDLDGDLLVSEESQPYSGGFQWGKEGRVVVPNLPGIGLQRKNL